MNENEEFIREFLEESEENLDQVDQDLVALEANPRDLDRLARIFRAVHTIKGTSGFFGFSKLGALAHSGENLLSRLRDGELILNPPITDGLLELVDALRRLLAQIDADGSEGEADLSSLTAQLTRLATAPPVAGTPVSSTPIDEITADEKHCRRKHCRRSAAGRSGSPHRARGGSPVGCPAPPSEAAATDANAHPADPVSRSVEPTVAPDEPGNVSGQVDAGVDTTNDSEQPGAAAPASVSEDAPPDDNDEPELPGEADTSSAVTKAKSPPTTTTVETLEPSAASPLSPLTPPDSPPPPADPGGSRDGEGSATSSGTAGEGTIRVDVALLDRLMNLAGELVLARNQLRQLTEEAEDSDLHSIVQRLDVITSNLQEHVTRTRMQPIGNIWGKYPRVVRDLANHCDKQVRLTMEGHETELDRSLLEAVKDPLTHLLRNAVDHGIESPEVRRLQGKPPTGQVHLRAFHEGGLVNVQIIDDGGGIDAAKIREKALAKGLVEPDQVARLSSRQLTELIFLPGLSTAKQVSDVSGRGVGMDVVKTNIERIGGTIEIDSELGRGTRMEVKIPLTLAIIPALVVHSGGQRFAIPQSDLVELLIVGKRAHGPRIETYHSAPVLRLRDQLVPMVYLNQELRLDKEASNLASNGQCVVVLQVGDQSFGLVVDGIVNTEEIVVKPLSKSLARLDVYSGATVLGDGGVALILDSLGLMRRSGIAFAGPQPPTAAGDAPVDADTDVHSLVLCELSGGRQAAVPLDQVTRLERFSAAQLQISAGQEALEYHGRIMPLVHLDEASAFSTGAAIETLDVIVCGSAEQPVGVVVGKVLDVVSHPTAQSRANGSPGIHDSLLIEHRLTDLIDLRDVLRRVPGFIA